MVHKQFILAILLIFAESIAEGKTVFGKCLKYGPKEGIPYVKGKDRYCLPDDDGNQYCLFFTCPPTSCTRPLSSLSGRCLYCTGTCSYGGKIFNTGGGLIACLDGSNHCVCSDKNEVVTITKIGPNYQVMCNKQQ